MTDAAFRKIAEGLREVVNSLATPSLPARKRRYEGSPADERQDKRSAKKRGMSVKAYERTAEDKRQDKAGQKRLDKARKR